MKRFVIVLALLLWTTPVFAQVVAQGAPGDLPWLVSSSPASDVVTTGTINGVGQCVTSTLTNGSGTGSIQTSGTAYTGTLIWEQSVDGSNFSTMYVASPTDAILSTNDTFDVWRFSAAGLSKVRVCSSSWTSGSANITIRSSAGTGFDQLGFSYGQGITLTNAVNSVSTILLDGTQVTKIKDTAGNTISTTTSTPGASDPGLITRNIPSGTQAVSGTVTTTIGATGTASTSANGDTIVTVSGSSTLGLRIQWTGDGIITPYYGIGGTKLGTLPFAQVGTGAWTVYDEGTTVDNGLTGEIFIRTEGLTQVILNVSGRTAGTITFTWALTSGSLNHSTSLRDNVGRLIASSAATPGGGERALIVRNIPSGTQTVNGPQTEGVINTFGDTDVSTAGYTTLVAQVTAISSAQFNGKGLSNGQATTLWPFIKSSSNGVSYLHTVQTPTTTGTYFFDVSGFAQWRITTQNLGGGSLTIAWSLSNGRVAPPNVITDANIAGLSARVVNTTPSSEAGLVVRNIPSGTQNVNVAQWIGSALPTIGQKTMSSSLPVAIASDQGTIKVGGDVAPASADGGNPVKIGGVFNTTQPTYTNGQRGDAQISARGAQIVATGADTFNVTVANTTFGVTNWLGSSAPTVGQKAMASSVPVVIASDQSSFPVTTKSALTANAPATASGGVASAQIVASNAARKGLVVINRSVNTCSLGIGATAVLNSGISLEPGAVWTMNEYTFVTGAVNAICGAASSTISIQEFQ